MTIGSPIKSPSGGEKLYAIAKSEEDFFTCLMECLEPMKQKVPENGNLADVISKVKAKATRTLNTLTNPNYISSELDFKDKTNINEQLKQYATKLFNQLVPQMVHEDYKTTILLYVESIDHSEIELEYGICVKGSSLKQS
jgi:hypothetical protein